MANGARMEGIDANLFFHFFGLDAIHKAKHDHVKVATVGNPGLHLATWPGGFPGVSSMVTHKFATEMEKLDIPPIPEFIEMIADSGAGVYACKASVDMFHLTKDDSSPRYRTSSPSASSTASPPAARSFSSRHRRTESSTRKPPANRRCAARSNAEPGLGVLLPCNVVVY